MREEEGGDEWCPHCRLEESEVCREAGKEEGQSFKYFSTFSCPKK